MGGNLALLRIVNIDAVMIEGRQGPDRAHHNGHGMGVAAEGAEEPIKLLVQHGVIGDGALEFDKLGRIGQFAVQQEVTNFEEA